jgi:hypothetical protein
VAIAGPPAGLVAVTLLQLAGVAVFASTPVVGVWRERLAPAGTAVEAFAWVITAFTVGSAAGVAITGPLAGVSIRAGSGSRPSRACSR